MYPLNIVLTTFNWLCWNLNFWNQAMVFQYFIVQLWWTCMNFSLSFHLFGLLLLQPIPFKKSCLQEVGIWSIVAYVSSQISLFILFWPLTSTRSLHLLFFWATRCKPKRWLCVKPLVDHLQLYHIQTHLNSVSSSFSDAPFELTTSHSQNSNCDRNWSFSDAASLA